MDRRTLLRTAASAGALSLAGCSALPGFGESTPTNPDEAARAGLNAEGSWSGSVRSIGREEGTFQVWYNIDEQGIENRHVAEEYGSRTAINVLSAVADVGLDADAIDVTGFVTTSSGNPFPVHQVGASAETVADVDWEGVEVNRLWDHVEEYEFNPGPMS